MRIFKYLAAIWTAVAIYAFLSFLSGPKGISAYNFLLAEKEQQLEKIEELEIINSELELTRNNLLYDYDTLLVHARRLGYGYEDERYVRIVGLGNIITTPAAAGQVYKAQYPDFISDKSIKIAALCAGLLVFAFLFMMELITRSTN